MVVRSQKTRSQLLCDVLSSAEHGLTRELSAREPDKEKWCKLPTTATKRKLQNILRDKCSMSKIGGEVESARKGHRTEQAQKLEKKKYFQVFFVCFHFLQFKKPHQNLVSYLLTILWVRNSGIVHWGHLNSIAWYLGYLLRYLEQMGVGITKLGPYTSEVSFCLLACSLVLFSI